MGPQGVGGMPSGRPCVGGRSSRRRFSFQILARCRRGAAFGETGRVCRPREGAGVSMLRDSAMDSSASDAAVAEPVRPAADAFRWPRAGSVSLADHRGWSGPGRLRSRGVGLLAVALLLLGSGQAASGGVGSEDAQLTPREIYERALRNLMDAATLQLELVSTAPGGHQQHFEIEMMWQRYPAGSPEAAEGIVSRSLARYLEPFDLRETGALVVDHREGRDEQFLYVASRRRVQRLNLRGQNVFGTDFAVEDLVPRRILEGAYRRLSDGEVDGIACYVVEVSFGGLPDDRYSRGYFYIEKRHFTPLLIRYWDKAGVEDKQLRIDPKQIREIGGLSIPTEMTVVSLRSGSKTHARIIRLVVNPPLTGEDFSLRHLEQHSVGGIPDRFYEGAHVFEAFTDPNAAGER